MKITIGKYIYQGREAIERAVNRLRAENDIQQAQLSLVGEWARQQLEMHQPYVHAHDLDLSCHKPDKMKAALAEKIQRNIWCARCSNPWPCRHIAALRLVRDAAGHNDLESLEAIAAEMRELPLPEARAGQIGIRL